MLPARHDHWLARVTLVLAGFLAHRLRAWARARRVFINNRMMRNKSGGACSVDFTEWEVPGRARDGLLEELSAAGWRSCGVTSSWDLEKDGARLLLATERDERGNPNTLVRMCGVPTAMPECIRPTGGA
jgi:hypothetical protein